jgi:hypothetical protein
MTAMSTPLYLVRVLEVAPEERRVRVRVIVTFYTIGGEDTGTAVTGVQPHLPLPRDASFFLRVLWDAGSERDGGPINDEITVDQICTEEWVDEHCRRFVDQVEQLAVRNDPPVQWLWPPMHHAAQFSDTAEFSALRTYGDYDVSVTDERWLRQATPGHLFDTTSYATWARGYTNTPWSTRRTCRPRPDEPGPVWRQVDDDGHYAWGPGDDRPDAPTERQYASPPTYRVEVLAVDAGDRRVELRASTAHYLHRTEWTEPEWLPPSDASFFLSALREVAGPADPLGQALAEVWRVNDRCVAFIDRVDQVAVRNMPTSQLRPEMGETGPGTKWPTYWGHSALLTQAEYRVWVTDARWIQHVAAGQVWDSDVFGESAYGYESRCGGPTGCPSRE